MKLRLHKNSIRLGLSQPDVARLRKSGCVEERAVFPARRPFTNSIETTPVDQIGASFEDGRLSVVVPCAVAKNWIETDSFPNPLAESNGREQ